MLDKIYTLDELKELGFYHRPHGTSGNLEIFKHFDEDKKNYTYLFIHGNEGYKLNEIYGLERKLRLDR